MEITQGYKNEMEKKIVECMILALENNNLQDSELPQIADLILDNIDNIKTHTELINLLGELSSRWPIFKNIELLEKGEVKEQKENVVVQDVLELARNGKIDDAITLAKSATDK